MLKRACTVLGLLLLTGVALAAQSGELPSTGMSIGSFANELMGPAKLLTKVFEDVALVAGVGFLFAALVQYKAHRENPSQVRLSKPVSYVFFGVVLILFPFVGYLTTYHPAMVSL
jgi:hypothetical protein